LLESGSAISFVKLNAFKRIFGTNVSIDRVPYDNIYAANDLEIETTGSFKARLRLNVLPNFTPSVVLVISDNFRWPVNMLLGRDFLISNQISVLYTPLKTDDHKAKVELFSNVAFADVIDIPKNSFSLLDIQTDFDSIVKERLVNVIESALRTPVDKVSNDEYLVKVSLKDDSIYAFAPEICLVRTLANPRNNG